MKVFLTGGTGFIGLPLTRSLLARGWDVVALVRRPESAQARALTRMGARCVAGDVTDRESMRDGMTGAEIVVHNAGWYEIGLHEDSRQLMHAINVVGTDNVLGLALELGIQRAVYVSSTIIFGDTGLEVRDEHFRRQTPYRSYYEQSKSEAHEIAVQYRQRGLPVMAICPAHVVGPNDHSVWGYFLRMYLNRIMPPVAWSPEIMISPVHVDDVGEGIALAAEKGKESETYILSGDSSSLRGVLDIWATQPGGFKVRFYLPKGLTKLLFTPLEPVVRWAGLPAFVSREVIEATASLNFSSAKAQTELGWRYRPKQAMWLDIIDQERKLQAERPKYDLISRLNPV